MAIGVEVSQLQSKDVKNGPSVGSVIDVSFFKELKLKSGKDQKLFEKAINDRAEQQIDNDLGNPNETQILKSYMSSGRSADKYFDDAMIGDYYHAKDGMKSLLEEYVDSVDSYQSELTALTNAINFQLTPEGNNKVMNGEKVENYYNQPEVIRPVPSSSNNVPVNSNSAQQNEFTPSTQRGRISVGENKFNPTSNLGESLSKTSEQKDIVPNTKVLHSYENIYARTNMEGGKDIDIDSSNQEKRRLLRHWIEGNKDDFLDIQELSGRDKINQPTKEEVNRLRDQFRTPLKRLTINNSNQLFRKGLSKGSELNEIRLWEILVENFNSKMIPSTGTEESYNKAWLSNTEVMSFLNTEKDQKLFAKEMAKLSLLYSGYRVNGSHINGSYTGKLIAMMDGAVLRKKAGGYADIHNLSNNEVGDIALANGISIITKDKPRFQKKAIEDLIKESGLNGSINMEDIIKSQKPTSAAMKMLLNQTQISKEQNLINNNLKPLYDYVRSQKLDNRSTDDGSLILAEGYAFGANPVDLYNIKMIATHAIPLEGISDAKRFVNFLSDFNNNGRTGPEDHGVNGGSQILENFRIASGILKSEGSQDPEKQVAMNILSYMRTTSGNKLDHYVKETLESYIKSGDMVGLAREHPAMIVYMQDTLKNLPANTDMQSLMLRGGVHTERDTRSLNSLSQNKDWLGKMNPEEKKQYDLLINQKFDSFQNHLNSLNLTDDEKAYFGYITRESLAQHISQTVSNVLEVNQYGGGIGTALEITKNIQLNASLAMGPDGVPVPGVGLGLNTETRKGGFAGLNANFLVPALSARIGHGWKGDISSLGKTLQSKGLKNHAITLHGGVSSLNIISVGLGYQQDIDHMGGIQSQYEQMKTKTLSGLRTMLDGEVRSLYNSITASVKNNNYIDTYDGKGALTKDKNKIITLLANKLAKQYNQDTNSTDLIAAANNIFEGMINTEFDGSAAAYEGLASYFAEQHKTAQVNALKGKTKVTGRGVGLHMFVSPVGLIGVLPFTMRVSKYDRGYKSVDTNESLKKQKQAEWEGRENRFYEMSAAKKVDLMNDLLPKGLQENQKLTLSADGAFIELPYSLFESDTLNLKISPTMKEKMAIENRQDGENVFVIPVNAPLRFSCLVQQNTTEYVLNIGSTVTSSQDVHLIRGRDNSGTLRNAVSQGGWGFKDSRSDILVAGSEYREGIDITDLSNKLSSYGITNSAIQDNMLSYVLDGKNSTVSLNNGVITLSDGRTITFSLGNQNTLSFIVKTKDGKVIDGKKINQNLTYIKTLSDSDINAIDSKSNNLLETYEKNNRNDLENFIDGAIDAHKPDQFQKSLDALKKLEIPEVNTIINSNDLDKKRELIAYMTQAFAIENTSYKNKTASQLMIERDKTNKQGKNNPAFMRIAGSDGLEEVFGSKSNGDARSVFEKINGINEKPNSSKEPQNNLIGYTAFYRSGSNKDARGYAMTLPGYTRILGNETNKFDSDSKRIAAKNWLTSKISQDEFAKKTILSSLQKNLVDLPDVAKQLTVDNIVTLLQNPEGLPLNGCSVKLNAVPVYYLLAECANESIGLEIESITCTPSSGGEGKSDSITVDGNLKKTYDDGLFALNTTRTTSSDEIGRRTLFNAGVAVSGKIDSKNVSSGPKEGDVLTNPGGGSEDGNGGTGSGPGGSGSDTGNNNTGAG